MDRPKTYWPRLIRRIGAFLLLAVVALFVGSAITASSSRAVTAFLIELAVEVLVPALGLFLTGAGLSLENAKEGGAPSLAKTWLRVILAISGLGLVALWLLRLLLKLVNGYI